MAPIEVEDRNAPDPRPCSSPDAFYEELIAREREERAGRGSTAAMRPLVRAQNGGRGASLFLVHAHPDDESITTGGVIVRAKREGRRVVVVTCTRGEEGEIHNMDERRCRPLLAEIRERELRRACGILGVDRVALLGYRDSGMAGSASNDDPSSFHRAPAQQAGDRLAAIMREERPQVVITYSPDGTYGHPDHVKAHVITHAALAQLREEGWRPAKVYWHVVPRSLVRRLEAEGCLAHPAMRRVGFPDAQVTTAVDVSAVMDRKLAAVAAHVSQLPRELGTSLVGQVLDTIGGFEHYVLVGGCPCEEDLFAGLPRHPSDRAAAALVG